MPSWRTEQWTARIDPPTDGGQQAKIGMFIGPSTHSREPIWDNSPSATDTYQLYIAPATTGDYRHGIGIESSGGDAEYFHCYNSSGKHVYKIDSTGGEDGLVRIYNSNEGNTIVLSGGDGGWAVFGGGFSDRHDNDTVLTVPGKSVLDGLVVLMPNLPTSDPGVADQLWNDSGTLKVSSGA